MTRNVIVNLILIIPGNSILMQSVCFFKSGLYFSSADQLDLRDLFMVWNNTTETVSKQILIFECKLTAL
jgi:hypothetical protein